MSSSGPLRQRVVELESLLTHMQHDLESLNQVILDQQSEIGSLKEQIARLEDRLGQFTEPSETRDPHEERPPHY